ASAWPVDQQSLRVPGVNGWFVPQKEGSLRWVNRVDAERQLAFYEGQEQLDGRLSTNTVKFYLYTQKNPSTGQEIKATQSSIDASNFNPKNPTRITIHGWNSNYKDGVNTRIADAWFQYGDYNMIAVDWSRGRSLEYATSVAGASGAGKKVAALVDFLVTSYGISLESLEIVGFSLGAHVAGHTGKQLTTGKAGKIVGLDPASPLISYSKSEKRLSSDDAIYVESIQTNGAILGFTQPIGRAAFYMNGGRSQPGCGIDVTGSCSHTRAVLYYVEALLWNNFPSKSCETYQEANKNACGDRFSSITMGAAVNTFVADGIFYVPVNKASPYGYGEVNTGGDETTAAPVGSTTSEGPEEISTTAAAPTDAPTTTAKPTEVPTTTGKPTELPTTTPAPEEDSTTEEPEEVSTTARPTEVPSTTGKPTELPTATTTGNGEDDSTLAPEDVSTTEEPEEDSTTAVPTTTAKPTEIPTTTSGPTEVPSSTADPEEDTTAAPEEDTTAAPEEDTSAAPEEDTTAAPEEDTTAAPEEDTSAAPEEDTTAAPEEDTTAAPEEDTTAVPEEDTTAAPEEDTTAAPEEDTTAAPEEDTTAAPEEDTTAAPEEDTTAGEPEEVSTTTAIPTVPTSSTARPTELPNTTWFPDVTPTLPPNVDDNSQPGSTKNIFIFNVFLVNVKVS
ncbi:hypothetical protein KR032_004284, partial [Drosophila birchii]